MSRLKPYVVEDESERFNTFGKLPDGTPFVILCSYHGREELAGLLIKVDSKGVDF